MTQTPAGKPSESPPFVDRLRQAVAGPAGGFVFLGNFEVEEHWAVGKTGLPKIAVGKGRAVVNGMEAIALLLAGDGGCVLLKAGPDAADLASREHHGVALPGRLGGADRD